MNLRRIIAVASILSATALNAVDFNRDIRPVLSDKCFACHGPDAAHVKADLRLDLRENAVKKPKDGHAAIVPSDPDQSELIARITATDTEDIMPPIDFHKAITPAEVKALRQWIKDGAKYEKHWAYQTLDWPQVPKKKTPPVRSTIDSFVQSKDIKPAPEADRRTLARRLSFDLLGLPPTADQVDKFINDKSPKAYENLVDALLKSPHYGERMAAYWLDLVRYADTRGYHGDQHQDITPYRDYVINAFNRNYPFDRFTAEQLAGDLLPEPTMEQKIASGYNKLLMTTTEGGAQAKEYIAKYAADRVRNASTVWLGSTLGCAECHDHKYDPFTQKDFYSFAAFFADVKETPVGGLTSIIKLPTEAETKKLADLNSKIHPLEKEIKDSLAKIKYEEPSKDDVKKHVAKKQAEAKAAAEKARETIIVDDQQPACQTVRANKDTHSFKWDTKEKASGKQSWIRTSMGLAQDVFDYLKKPIEVQKGDSFFISVHLDPDNPPKAIMLQFRTDNWNHRANWGDISAIGYGGKSENAKKTDMGQLPKPGEWTRLEVPIAKIKMKPGSKVVSIACTLASGTVHWDKLGHAKPKDPKAAKKKDPLELEGQLSLASWEKWKKKDKYKGLDRTIKGLVSKAADKRSDKDQDKLLKHYLEHVWQPKRAYFAGLHKKLNPLKKDRDTTDKGILRTMIAEKLPTPRMLRVLPRGNWLDDSGDPLLPAVPASLGKVNIKKDQNRATRTDLAAWLTSKENPLVARVFMNRLWKIMFGRGLAPTLDDFGMQGKNPTHPELLDWLAMEFIASGWDVKHMVKVIAMSHTYRQSSFADEAQLKTDPYNDLLARQGRFRVDAEMVRDNALKVSGLLVDTIGGRSVKPYQPKGYWVHLNFPKRTYKHDEGD
ncbi:MAG: PSD1 and planctomycete cytochrome C domain-containing protein, partial [Limisphaerales bacterium]